MPARRLQEFEWVKVGQKWIKQLKPLEPNATLLPAERHVLVDYFRVSRGDFSSKHQLQTIEAQIEIPDRDSR